MANRRAPSDPRDDMKPETEHDYDNSPAPTNHTEVHEDSFLYEMGPVVAKGASCIVRRAVVKRKGTILAIKVKESVHHNLSTVIPHEVHCMRLLNHPSCLKVYKVFHNQNKTFIVCDMVFGGTVMDRILESRGFPEEDAAAVMDHLLEAVAYIHSKKVLHLGLEPWHILFVSGEPCEEAYNKVVVTGFHKARIPGFAPKQKGGDIRFVAPELRAHFDAATGPESDMWSIGAILYTMLCSFPPFSSALDRKVSEDPAVLPPLDFPSPFWDVTSQLVKDFIRKLLEPDPTKRMTLEGCFEHPWILAAREINGSKTPPVMRAELLLRRMLLFKDIDPTCQLEIAAKVHFVKRAAGEIMVKEGDTVEGLAFVLSGSVQLLHNGHEIDVISAGGFFGEAILLPGGKHVSDIRMLGCSWRNSRRCVRTHEVTELFMLPKADLLIMFEKYSTLKQRLSVIAGALLLRIKRAHESLPDDEGQPSDLPAVPDGWGFVAPLPEKPVTQKGLDRFGNPTGNTDSATCTVS